MSNKKDTDRILRHHRMGESPQIIWKGRFEAQLAELDKAIDVCNACDVSLAFVHKVFIIEGKLHHRYGAGRIDTCSPCRNGHCPHEKKIRKMIP